MNSNENNPIGVVFCSDKVSTAFKMNLLNATDNDLFMKKISTCILYFFNTAYKIYFELTFCTFKTRTSMIILLILNTKLAIYSAGVRI